MVMPCSRSAARPSTSSAKSSSPPCVPSLLRVGLERGELVLEEHLRFVEQPADQRALAVVDAAAGDEAQQALVLVRLQVPVDVLGDQVGDVRHQKYPSCFFFSIEPLESWSITRPCRSEVRASSISWMIAGSVSALALDRAGERIAAERAEAHLLHHRRLAGLERHALVVDHDQRAVALDHRPLLREVQRHDRNVLEVDVLPDVELGPVREREHADRSRPCACARCRGARARGADSSDPSGAAPSGTRRCAPSRATSPRRAARRRTRRRSRAGRAPASAPASS